MTISLYNQAQTNCKSQLGCVVPFIGRRSIRLAAFGKPERLNDPRDRLKLFFIIHSEEFMLKCDSCSAAPLIPSGTQNGVDKKHQGQ